MRRAGAVACTAGAGDDRGVTWWLSSGSEWGTREQAIPGEWAMLMLIIVLGAVLGLAVLWFTLLRHERTLRTRARRRQGARRTAGMMMTEIGAAADEPVPAEATRAGEAEADEEAEEVEVEEAEVAAEEAEVAAEEAEVAAEEAEVAAEGAEVAAEGAAEADDEAGAGQPEEAADGTEQPDGAPKRPGASGQRKLTDEILSRVESELAERGAPRWKELAALVHHEFGVTVHPSSIQRAVRRRRLAQPTQTA